MEALLVRGSMDRPISPYKSQFRNPRNIHHNHHHTVGLLQAPPPFLSSRSYPPYSLPQPPLLPLPAESHRRSAAAGKKPSSGGSRPRDAPRTPKKSKSPRKVPERATGSPKTGHSGPGPKELPRNNKLFVSSSGNLFDSADNCVDANILSRSADNRVDLFSGAAAFAVSPPPSSLPLPTFSLRPKLISCRAEAAAGVDSGATDDLRRLLRLR